MIWDNKSKGVKLAPRQPQTRKRGNYLLKYKIYIVGVLLFVFLFGVLVGRHDWLGSKYNSQNSNLPSQLDYSSVNDIYSVIRNKFDGKLDQNALLDGLKAGLAKATGDPYTEYFNPTEAKEFLGELNGSFEGIGAELGKDDNKNIVIIAPLSGFPAEKAGLKSKDIIAQINGASAYDLNINEAITKIRGPKGTDVKLKIVRGSDLLDFTITREQINVPSVKSVIENGIGIMTISEFSNDTANLAQDAAKDFAAQKVRGIILDLRYNPGGFLDKAISVSNLWLKNDQIILTERRGSTIINTDKAMGDGILNGIPTVVLIDSGSASASEITAGALHDNKAATLVGTKSYGKGSVQEPQNLNNGGLLKITIARWFTPNGINIDKTGLTPDVIQELGKDSSATNDPQKAKALEILK